MLPPTESHGQGETVFLDYYLLIIVLFSVQTTANLAFAPPCVTTLTRNNPAALGLGSRFILIDGSAVWFLGGSVWFLRDPVCFLSDPVYFLGGTVRFLLAHLWFLHVTLACALLPSRVTWDGQATLAPSLTDVSPRASLCTLS